MTQSERRLTSVDELTPERMAELRRIAQMATPGPWGRSGRIVYAPTHGHRQVTISVQKGRDCSAEEADAVALHIATFDPPTVLALLDEIERLRRERDAALDVLGREDIGDGAKVEGVRLILKGGDRGWPTRESERARLVAEAGECCRGAYPMCSAGCLVEAALRHRQRLADKVRGEA